MNSFHPYLLIVFTVFFLYCCISGMEHLGWERNTSEPGNVEQKYGWGTRLRWWYLHSSNLFKWIIYKNTQTLLLIFLWSNHLTLRRLFNHFGNFLPFSSVLSVHLVCAPWTHDCLGMGILFFTFWIDSECFLFTMSAIMSSCMFPISPSYTFLTPPQSLWCPSAWYLALWLHFHGIQMSFMKKTFQKL